MNSVINSKAGVRVVTAVLALCFAFAWIPGSYAQNGESESEREPSDATGFGLQASIFQYVRSTSVDLSRNLSDSEHYVMTPGDVFTLTLSYGVSLSSGDERSSVQYNLQLSEAYTLDVPVLGEIPVEEYDLLSLGSYVSTELKKLLPLQHVSLFLSAPAQFNVFVYGNVNQPGFLTVNPMLRVIDAIALSGGFKQDGSYRYIGLERQEGSRVLDISRFYSVADFASNPPLQPGDVIFVPSARRVVTVQGEIRYPGKYELIETDTLSSVLNLAGGLLPGSEESSIDLVRQGEANRALTVRVNRAEFELFAMRNGDIVRVRSSADNLARVAVEGAIWGRRVSATEAVKVPTSPVRVDLPYYESMSLIDVLEEVGGPTPFAEAGRSFILRGSTGSRSDVDIARLWETRDGAFDVTLFAGDTIVVPIRALDVFVTGMVASPGRVAYTSGYTVADYLLQAGGVDPRRASMQSLALVDALGKRSPVGRDEVVPRGSTIHVGRKMLFFVDDTVQNVLVGAAWVTSSIAVITSVVQFINLVAPLFGGAE